MQVNAQQLKYAFKKLEPTHQDVTSLQQMASILEKNHPQSHIRATIQSMNDAKGVDTPDYIQYTDKELKNLQNN